LVADAIREKLLSVEFSKTGKARWVKKRELVKMLSPGQLKRGAIIEVDDAPCVIESIKVQTPSSRGANTLWKVRARNLKTKQKVDKVYRGGDAVPEPNFERREVQFLYSDTGNFYFMDLEDYNQFSLPREDLAEESKYLIDNLEGIRSLLVDEAVIGVELPLTVDLKIVECDPSVKGNSATGRTKSATLETGLTIQVPEHLSSGETLRIDTSTGKFVQRVGRG
jgi:elongation factor P